MGGGSLQGLRRRNRRSLLALLRANGELHRADLARRAGLSRATVSTIVAELIADGIVQESAAPGRSRSGRAGMPLRLSPPGEVALGVEFGADSVTAVVVDLARTRLAERTLQRPSGSEAAIPLVSRALADAGACWGQVVGVGIAGHDGERSPAQLAAALGKQVDAGVAIERSVRTAALAEAVWGAGGDTLIYVRWSDEIDCGILSAGRPLGGATGQAGRLGHVVVDEHGPACSCGNRGCLQVYAAAPAILAALSPSLGDRIGIGDVLAAAAGGERASRRVLADAGAHLGRVLGGVCTVVNPERVVVGGMLAPAADVVLPALREALRRNAVPAAAACAEVVPTALGPRNAALGAAALALQQIAPDSWTTT